jgi:DNA polymerase elongation subunit (family B)
VVEARRGVYAGPVCVFELQSLLPSVIITHNLSYETHVRIRPSSLSDHTIVRHPPSTLTPTSAATAATAATARFSHDDVQEFYLGDAHAGASPGCGGWGEREGAARGRCGGDGEGVREGQRGRGGDCGGEGEGGGTGRTYFYKKSAGREGVLPLVLKRLLDGRNQATALAQDPGLDVHTRSPPTSVCTRSHPPPHAPSRGAVPEGLDLRPTPSHQPLLVHILFVYPL